MVDGVHEEESKVVKAFMTFGNIFALNILWIVFSLPVFTIGASTTALYSMMIKMVKNEEDMIFKGFVKAFKQNFGKATLAWLIVLAACAVIYVEFYFSSVYDTAIGHFYFILAIAEVAVLLLIAAFLFPVIARYENTLLNCFKNALLLSVSNLGSCLKILVAWIMPIYLTTIPGIFLYVWYLWLVFGFGLIAYGTSFTIRKVFDRVAAVQETKD